MSPQPNPILQSTVPGLAIGDYENATYQKPSYSSPPPVAINVIDAKWGAAGDLVTDDTAAVQRALNAAGALGPQPAHVVLPAGYGFLLSKLTPPSCVAIWAYGATIKPNNPAQPLFSATSPLNDFQLRGGTWLGNGNETQNLVQYAAASLGGARIRVQDTYISGWGAGPFLLRGCSEVLILNNVLENVGLNSTFNVFSLGWDETTGAPAIAQKIIAGNIVNGFKGSFVDINVDTAGTVELGTIIANNSVHSALSAQVGFVNHESTQSGNIYQGVVIVGNDFAYTGSNGNGVGIAMAANGQFEQVEIRSNRIYMPPAGSVGISAVAGTECYAAHNRITAPTPISGSVNKTGNRYSSGPVSGRATLAAGTVTVNTAEVVAADNITLSRVVAGGALGELSIGTIVAGTSFVINSSSSTETSTVFWRIDH